MVYSPIFMHYKLIKMVNYMYSTGGLFNNSQEKLHYFLDQYKPIAQLNAGQKLTVNPSNQSLEISYGSATSYLSKAFMGLSRTVANVTGSYASNWEKVAAQIETINTTFQQFINQDESSLIQLGHRDLQQMKSQLEMAAKKLKEMGNVAYKNDLEAKERFVQQSNQISQLVKKVEFASAQLKEEKIDEEDWVDLTDSQLTKTKDHKEEEEDWMFVQGEAVPEIRGGNFALLSEEAKNYEQLVSSFEMLLDNPDLLDSQKSNQTMDEQNVLLIDSEYHLSPNQSEKLSSSSFVLVGEANEKAQSQIEKMNHPLFDSNRALELCKQMQEQFGALAENKEAIKQWEMIAEQLNRLPMDSPLKPILTDLVTVTLLPPTYPNGQVRSIMSLDKLLSLLKDVANEKDLSSWALIQGLKDPTSLMQRLQALSLLNFPDHLIRRVCSEPIYQAVINSPNLETFWLNAIIHVPQVYRQTCVGAAHHLFLQSQSGTVAELIGMAKETIEMIENRFQTLSPAQKQKLAFEVNYGKALTVDQLVSQVLVDSKNKLATLTHKALDLASAKSAVSPPEIASLTREWNFLMQDLDTILDPENPRVFSYQYLPDTYYVSAALSAILTGIGQLLPNSPIISERWVGLEHSSLRKLCENLIGVQRKQYVHRHEYSGGAQGTPILTQLTPQSIWTNLNAHGGGFVDFDYISGKGVSGHTIFVKAKRVEDIPLIEIFDPMDHTSRSTSIQDFYKLLSDNYEKQKGKVKVTNHLYVYNF